MTHPTDTESVEWPREIWAAERGEHDPDGRYVLSEHATVPRWKGDRECEFQRYVDGDIYDSADRYWRDRCDALAAERDALEAQLAEAREEGRRAGIEQAAREVEARRDANTKAYEKTKNPGWLAILAHLDQARDAIRALTDAEPPRSATVTEAAKVLLSAGSLPSKAVVEAHKQIDWCRNDQNTHRPEHPSQRPGSSCAEDIQDAWRATLRALAGEGRDDG